MPHVKTAKKRGAGKNIRGINIAICSGLLKRKTGFRSGEKEIE